MQHASFAQYCFFPPLPLVPVGIQNTAGCHQLKNKRPGCIREMQVNKLGTEVYSPKELSAMGKEWDSDG